LAKSGSLADVPEPAFIAPIEAITPLDEKHSTSDQQAKDDSFDDVGKQAETITRRDLWHWSLNRFR
jgi:hypothetical protein